MQFVNSIDVMEENGDPFGKSSVVSARLVEDHPPPPWQQVQLVLRAKETEENGDILFKYHHPRGATISRWKLEVEFFSSGSDWCWTETPSFFGDWVWVAVYIWELFLDWSQFQPILFPYFCINIRINSFHNRISIVFF